MGKVVSAILTGGFTRRREVRPVSHKDGSEGATPSAGILEGNAGQVPVSVSKAEGALLLGVQFLCLPSRVVAQSSSALLSESKGRGCESRSPDHATAV